MNLALFCVWEDAKVWAHWNYSYDMHLNYLEPVSCFSPSWIPLWCTAGAASVADGLMASTSFVYTHLAGGIFGPQWYLASLRASALREWASEKDPKMEAVTFYSLSLRNDAPLFCHLVHRRTLVQLGRGLHGIWILGGGSKWGPFWRLATVSSFALKLEF